MKAPPLRRYQITDATVESLGEILIENQWGVLVYRDELNGLLRSLDKEGQEGARSFYLQGYDGNQPYTFDRIMRGKNLHIPAVCFAMLGGIQPGKVMAYIHDAVKGGSGDDGLLQRFGMLVWPDITKDWINVDEWPDTEAKKLAFQTFEALDEIQPALDDETGNGSPRVLKFSAEAQNKFDDWRFEFETNLRNSDHHPAMESHLSKYRKLVPAIALVCGLADGEDVVSAVSLTRSLAWIDYLESHAARIYAAGMRPSSEGAKALLRRIRSGDVKDGFKSADVYQKGWSHLATSEDAIGAIKMLTDLDYLAPVDPNPLRKTGRPSVVYRINPWVFK